jgi:recombinational DNA repair ATPase RecF
VVKLRRLKIEKFRNVEPTELTFGDRFNVLLGLNGTG